MATKDMKQPYWIAGDRRTVMRWDGDNRAPVLTLRSLSEAHEFCSVLICGWQVEAYGGVDPDSDLVAIATKYDYPIASR